MNVDLADLFVGRVKLNQQVRLIAGQRQATALAVEDPLVEARVDRREMRDPPAGR
jgi:hypothetical protein